MKTSIRSAENGPTAATFLKSTVLQQYSFGACLQQSKARCAARGHAPHLLHSSDGAAAHAFASDFLSKCSF